MRFIFEFPTIKELAAQLDDVREASLLADIEDGGNEMEALLERVAAMPESKAQELVRQLRIR